MESYLACVWLNKSVVGWPGVAGGICVATTKGEKDFIHRNPDDIYAGHDFVGLEPVDLPIGVYGNRHYLSRIAHTGNYFGCRSDARRILSNQDIDFIIR